MDKYVNSYVGKQLRKLKASCSVDCRPLILLFLLSRTNIDMHVNGTDVFDKHYLLL